ncbi:MAG TPA: MarR family winged helix-turn-helix transcriptional regulator [Puia sp.]
MQQATITGIRAFNRYYTGILGLLDRHILNSDYSLPEARILYELNQREGVQASGIIGSLGIDKGYLSRILDQFATKKLIVRKRSQADGRLMHIYLTEKGRAEFEKLNKASDEQLKSLLNGLSATDAEELNRHMTAITHILLKAQTAKEK